MNSKDADSDSGTVSPPPPGDYVLSRDRKRRSTAGNRISQIQKEMESGERRRQKGRVLLAEKETKNEIEEYIEKELEGLSGKDDEFVAAAESPTDESDSDIDDDIEGLEQQQEEDSLENDDLEVRKSKKVMRHPISHPYKPKKRPRTPVAKLPEFPNLISKRSIRESTAKKREERLANEKKSVPKAPQPKTSRRRLTQQELMDDALITEKINSLSLQNYANLNSLDMELGAVHKKKFRAPGLACEHIGTDSDSRIITKMYLDSPTSSEVKTSLTFTDDLAFEQMFPPNQPKPKVRVQKMCPVTHKPARYTDPLTNIGYYNAAAFKIIREIYNERKADEQEKKK